MELLKVERQLPNMSQIRPVMDQQRVVQPTAQQKLAMQKMKQGGGGGVGGVGGGVAAAV